MYTFSSTWYHARKSIPYATCKELVARQRRFHSAPLLYIVMPRYLALIVSLGIHMFHRSYQGWGSGYLLRTTMVSSKFRYMKSIQRLVQLVFLPGNPSTEKFMGVDISGKANPYYFGIRIYNSCGSGLAYPYHMCCI